MTLSIIIPVYNVADTLRECVESVRSQSFTEWEMLLIDDGSVDGSGVLADEIARTDSRISVCHKSNGGLSDARNYGLDRCHGNLIMFVDSDDMLAESTLEPLIRTMVTHPEYDVLEYPVLVHAGHSSEYLFETVPAVYGSPMEWWENTRGYEHTWAWNKVYRRSLFEPADGCGEPVRFPVGRSFEDAWTICDIMQRSPVIAVTDKGCYIYRWNRKGITCNASRRELRELLEAHIRLCAQMEIDLREPRWHHYYMALLNQQIVLYALGGPLLISGQRLRLSCLEGWKNKVKALVLNTLGLKTVCRIFGR